MDERFDRKESMNTTENQFGISPDSSCNGKLNAEQIKSWRRVLAGMIGPWALIMPDDDVQQVRDNLQRRIGDKLSK